MSESLTKADLAERLYEELGFNKREAKELVDTFFDSVRAALESNESVKLSGFGNPRAGEEIPISARRVVTFKPGQKLRERVEAYAGTQS